MSLPKSILVTGADGFIGGALARNIPGATTDTTVQVDAVLHQAANNDTLCNDEDAMFAANVDYTMRLFRRLLDRGCKTFVFASSTAVYGNGPTPFREDQELQPLNAYAKSKWAMEREVFEWARFHDVRAVALRYCNVYGPGECHKGSRASTIRHLVAQLMRGECPQLFRDGSQSRDWVHIDDVVNANILALQKGQGVFNVGSGSAISFRELAELVADAVGIHRNIDYVDMPFSASKYQSYTLCDLTKAREQLGYSPAVPLKDGVNSYVRWLREYGEVL